MRRSDKIYDERVIAESNRIYKKSFFLFCAVILADLILKSNMSRFVMKGRGYWWLLFGLEAAFLAAMFYFDLFAHARKGILVGATDLPNERFPKKRFCLIGSVISLTVSVGLWGTRFAVYAIMGLNGDIPLGAAVILMLILCAVTFALLFAVLYISFFAAYLIASKQNKSDLASDEN